MSLYLPPITQILAEIKRLNPKAPLVESEYTYADPIVIDPPVGLLYTSIKVISKDTDSTYDGEVTVRYTRWAFERLATLIDPNIRISNVASTWDVAQSLNAQFGFGITIEDIIDEAVVLVDGAGPVLVKARPTSKGWTGEVTFNVTPGRFDLGTLVATTVLPGLNYPNRSTEKPYGELYSYCRDFSGHYATLLAMDATETTPEKLETIKTILIAVTGDAWVTDSIKRFSLQGATITFNGPTTGQELPNPEYEYYMTIDLTADCQGLSGTLILHYSDPAGGIE
jgi:hypothetical protein